MEIKNITLELTLNGQMIRIAKNSVYRLLEGGIQGIEAPEYAIEDEKLAYADGAYIVGTQVMPRHITISFGIADRTNSEAFRRKLIRQLVPKTPGSLVVERSGVRRKIDFMLENAPEFQQDNIIDDDLHVTLNLYCADPYFRDEQDTTIDFKKIAPLFTFPFNSIAGVGVTAGIYTIYNQATIVNSGDVPIGVIVDITAKGGTVTNPQISLDTEYVRALQILQPEDQLRINTNDGQQSILLNQQPKFIFDRRSIFFQLPVGTNHIEISADAHVDHIQSSFTYALKYLGV